MHVISYRRLREYAEAENEQALAMLERLMHLSGRTLEQQELYELLIVLIEKFEQDFYQPQQKNNPLSMLLFLMEQQNIRSTELVSIFGSKEAVEDMLAGKNQINSANAESLGQLLHVDAILFT